MTAHLGEARTDCKVLLPCITTGAFSCVCTIFYKLMNKWVQLSTRFNGTSQVLRREAHLDWKRSKFDSLHTQKPTLKNVAREDLNCWCASLSHNCAHASTCTVQPETLRRQTPRCCDASHLRLFQNCHGDVGIPDFVICFIQQLSSLPQILWLSHTLTFLFNTVSMSIQPFIFHLPQAPT